MNQRIILGIGTGQCGTFSLASVLDRQADAQVSHQEPPRLPWRRPTGDRVIRQRFARFRQNRAAPVLGDVASFYLPYVEDIIAAEPEVRIVCLKRPRADVIAGFCQWLDKTQPLPVNHWAEEPAPGWYHAADLSHCFPQYQTQDREEGIGRYWDEYYRRVDDLVGRYPEHIRPYDTGQALNTEEGLRDLLTFAGFPPEKQVLAVGTNLSPKPERAQRRRARRASRDPMDPRRCVVLVLFNTQIISRCESALRELERRGYEVRRVGGYAAIDQGRNQVSTDALLDGYEETMWIDADTDFHPDVVDRLRSHALPIVAGICARKGKRAIACHVIPGTPQIVFGKGGGLVEVLYAGTGFLHVRRQVYQAVQHRLQLPVSNERFGKPMIPFFLPMLHECEDGYWYLAEDYSFCQRVRDAGFKIMADTSIRLWHVGEYSYGWEDAGLERPRYNSFTLNFPQRTKDGPGGDH